MALRGKVAIVTGASSGFGAGIAEYFSKEGAMLSITGRRKENLEAVAKKCGTADSVLITIGDMQDENIREMVIKKTIEKFGKMNILVNNAGIVHVSSFAEQSEESYDEQMNVNLKAPFFLTQLAAPYLIETKGSVVNISSAATTRRMPDGIVYEMSKTGLDSFTKALARELGPQGVRVNSVNPCFIPNTNIFRGRTGVVDHDESYEAFRKCIPLGRLGTTEDVAKAAAFFASDQSAFVTGQIFYVEGGVSQTAVF